MKRCKVQSLKGSRREAREQCAARAVKIIDRPTGAIVYRLIYSSYADGIIAHIDTGNVRFAKAGERIQNLLPTICRIPSSNEIIRRYGRMHYARI